MKFFLLLSLLTANPAQAQGGGPLGNFQSAQMSGRALVIQSNIGQTLRLTPYGEGIVRVQAIPAGQAFFDDTRYEMVVPENHARMGGLLQIQDRVQVPGKGEVIRATLAGAGPGETLTVEIRKNNGMRLEFFQSRLDERGRPFTVSLLNDTRGILTDPAPSVQFEARPGERFTGMGHAAFGRLPDGLNLAGKLIERNRSVQVGAFVQAPLLVPFYVSDRGYGVFVNSTFPNHFSFNRQVPGGVEYSVKLDGGQMDYFLISGPSLRRVIDRYTRLTGRPRMIPGAALGLALSDKAIDKRNDADEKRTIAHSDEFFWKTKFDQMKRREIPWNILIHDNGWRGAKDGEWKWDPSRFPNPLEFKRFSDENGLLNQLDFNRRDAQFTPSFGIDPATRQPIPNRGFIPGARGPEGGEDFPDFTDERVRRSFFSVMFENTFKPGFAGESIWLDEFDFPINPPGLQANRRGWQENANYYFFLLEKAVAEGWDLTFRGQKRPYIISRGSSAGAQRFGFLWSGDLESDAGEMQGQIRSMQTAGISGFPFWSHDAGGFFGDRTQQQNEARHPNPVVYRNWAAAMGSFSPFWKPHGLGLRFPLDEQEANLPTTRRAPGFPKLQGFSDPEIEDMKRYAQLRMKLYPYNYTLARLAHDQGLPMARAMLIDNPGVELAWKADQQYMWGDQLLIAPMTDDGKGPIRQTKVAVWFPQGLWWDFNRPENGPFGSDGKQATLFPPRPQDILTTGTLPTFARAGAIIPQYQSAQTIKDLDRTFLELEIFPGADGAFDLIEDDENSDAFELNRAERAIPLRFENRASRIRIGDARGNGFPTQVRQRRYVITLHGELSASAFKVSQGQNAAVFCTSTSRKNALAGVAAPAAPGAPACEGGSFFDSAKKTLTLVTGPKVVVTSQANIPEAGTVTIEPITPRR